MADNYLEKRYSEVFKKKMAVDPETGYTVYSNNKRRHTADGVRKTHKLPDQ